LFFWLTPLYSQNKKPGGVDGAVRWNITEFTVSDEAKWMSGLSGDTTSIRISGNGATINNHPAFLLDSRINTHALTTDLSDLKNFTLFTVCQETDSVAEQVIFSLENDSMTQLVLSNYRMAVLDLYRYFNYYAAQNSFPRIYSYSQNQSDSTVSRSSRLLFGRSPQRDNLPVQAYRGIVPELILFDRYLSPGERRQVESYLALKYGISLQQNFPNSYLNSQGETIWDAKAGFAFNHHIAGIGRDDQTGLLQYTSESSECPGVLSISATDNFENNMFLIWSDNNQPLSFGDQRGIKPFQREWRITAFNASGKNCTITSNELSFSEIKPLSEGEVYWLMLDISGTGKFPFRQTEYIKDLNTGSFSKSLTFSPVAIDSDSSGSDVFTLLIAPEFFSRSLVLAPSCSGSNSGIIQTEIIGGEGPYHMVLVNESKLGSTLVISEPEDYHIFSDIAQGGYTLYVTDADNRVFYERIWISNSHAWESPLQSAYLIREGDRLHLDASEGIPAESFHYSWTTPEGITVSGGEINISVPGNYVVSTVDENGCTFLQEISVLPEEGSLFTNIELFPNPVKGRFLLRVELAGKSDVRVSVYDMNGHLITSEKMANQQYYRYNGFIPFPGLYSVVLQSGNEVNTLKLVVQ